MSKSSGLVERVALEPAGIRATAEDRVTAGMVVRAGTQATAPPLGTLATARSADSADTVVVHLGIQGSAPLADIRDSAQRAIAGTLGSAVYRVTAVFRAFPDTADSVGQAVRAGFLGLVDFREVLRLIQATAAILVRVGTRDIQPQLQGHLATAVIQDHYRGQVGSPDSAVYQAIQDFVGYRDILGSRVKVDTVVTRGVGSADTRVSAAGAGTVDSRQFLDTRALQE